MSCSSLIYYCSSLAARALCWGLMSSLRYAGALCTCLPPSWAPEGCCLCVALALDTLFSLSSAQFPGSLWAGSHLCCQGRISSLPISATVRRGSGKAAFYWFMLGLIFFHICKEAKPFLLLLLSVCGGINICWASSNLQVRAITHTTGVLSSERFCVSHMWTCLQII